MCVRVCVCVCVCVHAAVEQSVVLGCIKALIGGYMRYTCIHTYIHALIGGYMRSENMYVCTETYTNTHVYMQMRRIVDARLCEADAESEVKVDVMRTGRSVFASMHDMQVMC